MITRTKELLEDNADQVMQLLIQYSQSSRMYSCPHLNEVERFAKRYIHTSHGFDEPSPSGLYHLMDA